jgi:hypothetical protein
MAKQRSTPARPRDQNELAKRIVDLATGAEQDELPAPVSEAAAKRGTARAAKLSPERRAEIARQAAKARWKGQGG